MKLRAFHIQNFRSINDTLWKNISLDNITALIGQNESGKTTILESLYCFYTGKINEDVLKSDSLYPIITCSFIINNEIINDLENNYSMPPKVIKYLKENKFINLQRKWTNLNHSYILIEQQDIHDEYHTYENKEDTYISDIEEKIDEIINSEDNNSYNPTTNLQIAQKIKNLETEYNKLHDTLESITNEILTYNEYKRNELSKDSLENFKNLDQREKATKEEIDNKYKKLIYNKKLLDKVIQGMSKEQAEIELKEYKNLQETYLDITSLAEYLFECVPHFEFFEDFSSLLPNSIDLIDLENENTSVEGYFGVLNLLKVANIDLDFFKQESTRILDQKIEDVSQDVTSKFQKFWSQTVGKTNKIEIICELKHHSTNNGDKSGQPFIAFWIKDGREKLYPKQRSAGVLWFLSFFLQLNAYALSQDQNGRLLLIDEPAKNLHENAQLDVLEVFEELKNTLQLIYSTHSPSLLKISNIYRILAVQREDIAYNRSQTTILNAHELGAAHSDTLSPIYKIMGTSFANQQVIQRYNNVILEEISSFYYISSFYKLLSENKSVYFLPATGVNNVTQLAYLFLGWRLEYIIVVDDDRNGRYVYNQLKYNLFNDNEAETKKCIIKLKGFDGIEDIFSQTDFKNMIINEPDSKISKTNSQYVKNKSKGFYALNFYLNVNNKNIAIHDLDSFTQSNIKLIVSQINERLK